MLSYEELYEKYATDVLRVSYFYLGDRQRAEDVCQDVFVRLMTNAPDLQEGREGGAQPLPRPVARRMAQARGAGQSGV